MAASQLRTIGACSRYLRVSRRAFGTSSRRYLEAAVPANSKAESAVEDVQPKEISQAPNRTDVWSRSQKTRSKAMTGPRFEQTTFDLQPQPLSAMELVHKQPVRWTHDRMVACDGGGGPAGHPRIFINTDKPEITACNYCGLPFANEHHRKHLESLPETSLFKAIRNVYTSCFAVRRAATLRLKTVASIINVERLFGSLAIHQYYKPHSPYIIESGDHAIMPQPSNSICPATTLALILVLFIALNPDLFRLAWTLPCTLLSFSHSTKSPPSIPTLHPAATMSWFQKQFTLPAKSRGSYLITDQVISALPEIRDYKVGLLNLFVQHTSCALSLNENWDEDVRADMSDALDRIAPFEGPKGEALYRHDAEGPDDMPAHIKSALIGASVTIPIKDGKLATGTWQGIWYLEFRASRHQRRIMATIQGEKA
ncbi:Lactobacillus shifted protein [Tolypocladium ophioglossoides CBS 100239]|uniref:Lactobacillus shifted protein n=1 Tax=Tolypocladium ophioglossoides (strain CBS 100239) TaxID=1163406 RepID=A0A0L0NLM7_TOLOC|nr:Lactobacillus shifted protein [Tolypocladium ophioglossoides CBS 100239]